MQLSSSSCRTLLTTVRDKDEIDVTLRSQPSPPVAEVLRSGRRLPCRARTACYAPFVVPSMSEWMAVVQARMLAEDADAADAIIASWDSVLPETLERWQVEESDLRKEWAAFRDRCDPWNKMT